MLAAVGERRRIEDKIQMIRASLERGRRLREVSFTGKKDARES